MCGQHHHRMLQGSRSAHAYVNAAAGLLRGQGEFRQDWFSGKPTGSLLTEGTSGAIFKILQAPVVLTEGKKILSLVFINPRSNINFITHKLAGQLQLEGTLSKIFIKRENEDYTKKEVKVYRLKVEDAKKKVHWMEAVGVGSITESVPLQNKDKIRRDFPEILEGAVRRPAGGCTTNFDDGATVAHPRKDKKGQALPLPDAPRVQ